MDTVSATVTTKVKGQGYLPINVTKKKNFTDAKSYASILEINHNTKYMMLDTAGLFKFKYVQKL